MSNLKIGVIADDFTGATDIASFLVLNGLKTVQLCGVPEDENYVVDAEAIVISNKSRSCPAPDAIAQSLKCLAYLKKHGCKQIYFKYCSTFDSSKEGNIGPVSDALMKEMGTDFTVFSPALPVNGRTVYKGYLYVGDVLLSESGMRNHPITPMTDSSLVRLVEMQSRGKCGVVDFNTVRKGAAAIKDKINELKSQGFSYAVIDALEECDLIAQGEALSDMPLVTGGSGLAIGLARAVRESNYDVQKALSAGYPQGKQAVVLSGSCSVMTNKQVKKYGEKASTFKVEMPSIMQDDIAAYVASCADFVMAHQGDAYAPLVYATANPDELHSIQSQYGAHESSQAVERFFAALAQSLQLKGIERFIVAGGETSGIVTQSLNVQGFYIGPAIAPGVPWVRSINNQVSLTLKSGNFGDENFFAHAQDGFALKD